MSDTTPLTPELLEKSRAEICKAIGERFNDLFWNGDPEDDYYDIEWRVAGELQITMGKFDDYHREYIQSEE